MKTTRQKSACTFSGIGRRIKIVAACVGLLFITSVLGCGPEFTDDVGTTEASPQNERFEQALKASNLSRPYVETLEASRGEVTESISLNIYCGGGPGELCCEAHWNGLPTLPSGYYYAFSEDWGNYNTGHTYVFGWQSGQGSGSHEVCQPSGPPGTMWSIFFIEGGLGSNLVNVTIPYIP